MTQSCSEQRLGSNESPAGSQRSGVRRWLGRINPIWLVALGGGIAGLAIGLASFWTDPHSSSNNEVWLWRLPELPAGIEPQYRQQCEQAGAAVAQVLTAYPDSPEAVSALGVLYYLAHDVHGEESCWERCLTLDPANAFAYSRLFSLAEQQANYQRIVDLVSQAEAADPRNVAYRGRLGSALMYLQRNEEAQAVLEQFVNGGHGDADTYLVLGEVWYQLNEPRKAKRYFEAAAALAPQNAAMFFSLAKACAKLGETDLATHYRGTFQKLKDAEIGAQKGDASARQQVRDEVHIPIRVAEIMQHVGKAYRDANQLELAEKAWLRGVELNRDDIVSRELLSDLYLRQGRLEDALECIRELKRITPENHLHNRNEGLTLSRLKRYDEAEQVFRELCRTEPVGSYGYAALAQLLLLRGGNANEAQSFARRAVAFEPSGENLYLLAITARQAGDLATARDAIAQALAREPDNPQYRSFHASISNQK